MRVMTWNLWWRFGEAWRERQPAILSTLAALAPDVVGLQEVWGTRDSTQAQVLAGELRLHSAYGAPSLPPPPRPPESADQADVEVGVAVLSRWPILEVRRYELPSRHRPAVVALAVAVDHPLGPLHVVSCCLDWDEPARQRLVQARALAKLLGSRSLDGPLPVLLTADLNAPPAAPEIEELTDVMVDTWTAAGHGAEEGHTLSVGNPLAPRDAWQVNQRIDYVLARPGRAGQAIGVERAFIVDDSQDGVQPSDHYGVVADLRL